MKTKACDLVLSRAELHFLNRESPRLALPG
ncbi:hypothetical protein ACLK19_29460 [Escherichia coli]